MTADNQISNKQANNNQANNDQTNSPANRYQWQSCHKLLQDLQLDEVPAGASMVVYHRGECVVNSSVGESNDGRRWTADTLSLNFSTGKGVLATLVHCLVSKGLLAYDKAIADYWTEFGVNGKNKITLRQVLSHQANLFAIDTIISDNEQMLDFSAMVEKVANMSPSIPNGNYPQGSSAYSALVFGWVLAGLIEQVTKLSLQEALEVYLTKPLGISDAVFIGVPDDRLDDVAQPVRRFSVDNNTNNHVNNHADKPADKQSIKPSDQQALAGKNPSKKVRRKPIIRPDSEQTLQVYASLPSYTEWLNQWKKLTNNQEISKHNGQNGAVSRYLQTADINALYFDLTTLNKANYKSALIANAKQDFDYYDPRCLQATLPAVNCVASASALAKIYAMLANRGSFQGRELINADTFQALTQIQSHQPDAVMPATNPQSMHWRLGYHRVFSVCHQVSDAFGHMGYNGSVTWCDPSRELAVAFVHNYDTTMLNDIRQFAITEAILACAFLL